MIACGAATADIRCAPVLRSELHPRDSEAIGWQALFHSGCRELISSFCPCSVLAQLEGSALGMGFGVISSSVLPAQGVPLPSVSACVNAAKGPTGLASDFSHTLHGNIDRWLFAQLALAGFAGRIVGPNRTRGLLHRLCGADADISPWSVGRRTRSARLSRSADGQAAGRHCAQAPTDHCGWIA